MTDLGAVARASLTLSRPSNNVHKEKEQELKKAQLEQAYAAKIASKKAVLIVRADGEPEVRPPVGRGLIGRWMDTGGQQLVALVKHVMLVALDCPAGAGAQASGQGLHGAQCPA